MSPAISGSKNKPSKEPAKLLSICFHAGFLLGLFFNPEDGGNIFFRNVLPTITHLFDQHLWWYYCKVKQSQLCEAYIRVLSLI
jgi:hypothetical protein